VPQPGGEGQSKVIAFHLRIRRIEKEIITRLIYYERASCFTRQDLNLVLYICRAKQCRKASRRYRQRKKNLMEELEQVGFYLFIYFFSFF